MQGRIINVPRVARAPEGIRPLERFGRNNVANMSIEATHF